VANSRVSRSKVIQAPAPPVHGDCDAGVLEHASELKAGELTALVGVEDLGPAVARHRLVAGLDAEAGIEGTLI
jgi:hypothetical protein